MKLFQKTKNFCEKYELISFVSGNKMFILFALLLLSGMIFGTWTVNFLQVETIKKLDILFAMDFKSQLDKTTYEIFTESFLTVFLFAFTELLSAFSLFGIILIPAILVFRGFGIGLAAGYLYLVYGLKGIGYYTLILLPSIFFSSIGLILLSIESIIFSKKYAKVLLPNNQDNNLWQQVIFYLKKAGGILILFFISSGTQVLFFTMFSKFFI